jgi:hypothetical protein
MYFFRKSLRRDQIDRGAGSNPLGVVAQIEDQIHKRVRPPTDPNDPRY